MRILVCFKVIRELEYITAGELSALRDGCLDMSVFQQIIGSYDESALETALRLADDLREQKNSVIVHALTVGNCEDRFAKNLYALGFDEVICLAAEQDMTWRPECTAACIAAFVKANGTYDLILTGKQASPGESAQVPRLLAQELGMPCLPEVIELIPHKKGLAAVCKTDRGRCSLTLIRPAVCAIGEAVHPYLRVATLREKLAAASKKMQILAAAEIPPLMGTARRLHYIYETSEKQCRIIEGANLEQKVQILWAEYLGYE
jgi:electron transfer flavoprotein beta subunit